MTGDLNKSLVELRESTIATIVKWMRANTVQMPYDRQALIVLAEEYAKEWETISATDLLAEYALSLDADLVG